MSRPVIPMLSALSSARKAIQLYPPAHPTYREAIGELVQAVTEMVQQGSFALNLHEGRLYDGSDVIPDDVPAVASLSDAFDVRRVESVVFEPGFDESDAAGLASVLNLRPLAELDVQSELEARGVAHVRSTALTDAEAEERAERDRVRAEDRAAYQRLVTALRSLSARARAGEPIDIADAAPMVQGILERLLEDEAAVLGMATMGAGSEEDLLHAINVMIYTLNLGVAMDIPEEGLTVLGLAALTHDVGKAAFDRDDEEQARAAAILHPTVGADVLARIPDDAGSAAMLVAYEHHMGVDGSGYPERDTGYVQHPYSRMVAISNYYDRLTKGDVDTPALNPDRAVVQLLDAAGGRLDPFYTRLFVRALGVFPIGCAVRLTDHATGIVCGRGSDPLKPTVRLVFDERGIELENPRNIDLDTDEREIVEVVDPDALGIAVADYL